MPFETVLMHVLQRYWRFSRGLTLEVQGVVLDGGGRVLLVRHADRTEWQLPGGGVERNETAAAALRRTLCQQAGIVLTAPPRLAGVFADIEHSPRDHAVLMAVREWTQPPVPPVGSGDTEARFFAADALATAASAECCRRIASVLAGSARERRR